MKITKRIKDLAEKNQHISTEEILQDIADTEAEIVTMARDADHLEQTPFSSKDAKWNHMRASAYRGGIKKRREFIADLKSILAYRKKHQ